MKRRNKLFLIPLIAISLSSCMGDISELYDNNAYDGAHFTDNYYETWDNKLVNASFKEAKNYNVNQVLLSYNDLFYAMSQNKDDFYSSKGELLKWNYPGTIVSYPAPDGVDEYFGATHSLAYGKNGHTDFARGYVSKLYDGRVSCSGYHAQSRVQLSEKGYGTLFPMELTGYRYITLALRAATDISGGLGTSTSIDLTISFYVYDYSASQYQTYNFLLSNLYLTTDNLNTSKAQDENGSQTQMVSFVFNDVKGLESGALSRASAMSMSYVLHDNDKGIALTTDKTKEGNHYAVMLYEVLLPLSNWN